MNFHHMLGLHGLTTFSSLISVCATAVSVQSSLQNCCLNVQTKKLLTLAVYVACLKQINQVSTLNHKIIFCTVAMKNIAVSNLFCPHWFDLRLNLLNVLLNHMLSFKYYQCEKSQVNAIKPTKAWSCMLNLSFLITSWCFAASYNTDVYQRLSLTSCLHRQSLPLDIITLLQPWSGIYPLKCVCTLHDGQGTVSFCHYLALTISSYHKGWHACHQPPPGEALPSGNKEATSATMCFFILMRSATGA